jgi:hypothetical protein
MQTTSPHIRADAVYTEAIRCIQRRKIPFMIGGAFAMYEYGDIIRDTKDLDLFCKPGDYLHILQVLDEIGYHIEIKDPDWIGKASRRDLHLDIIFGAGNRLIKVNDVWLQHAPTKRVLGLDLKLVPPEEMIVSKIFVQERDRYDGADINHIIRKSGHALDWVRLRDTMDAFWELLYAQLVNFRFVYPSERDIVPEWLLRELTTRLEQQLTTPPPIDRVCRGPAVAYSQYRVDVIEWGYRT